MKFSQSFLIVALTFQLLFCLGQSQLPVIVQKQFNYTQQLLDHFSPLENRTWTQRYWVIDQFYNPEVGPILLYICGEYTCPGLPEARLWPAYLAQMYQGLIVVVEHRYYGSSMPFGEDSLKLENLYLLTVDQALADLAYFIVWFKDSNQFNSSSTTPVLTIGGSYPGAMSAWFKYKYPHLTIGSLASSAVVNSILDFYQFDEQIRTSALYSGTYCAEAIHNVNFYAQQLLQDPKKGAQLKAKFNASQISDGQFLYYFADIFVELIQYGSRTELCDAVKGETVEQILEQTLEYANQNQITPYGYSSYFLQNTSIYSDVAGSRAWTYQYCTEFGWMQTAPKDKARSMRGTWVNITMYEQFCNQTFNFTQIGQNKTAWPNVENTNLDLGGLDLKGFNIIFTNGIEDPWQKASLEISQGAMTSIVINCTDCAHCVDLYTPQPTDSIQLKNARTLEVYYFSFWLNNYWTNNQLTKNSEAKNNFSFVKPQLDQFMKEYLNFEELDNILKNPNTDAKIILN